MSRNANPPPRLDLASASSASNYALSPHPSNALGDGGREKTLAAPLILSLACVGSASGVENAASVSDEIGYYAEDSRMFYIISD